MVRNGSVWIAAFAVWVLLSGAVSANDTANSGNRTITGAGAHFSWIVFARQQQAIEQHIHRPLKLFGKEQMLGAGCNAGIRYATTSTPANESFGFTCCHPTAKEMREKSLKIYPIAREPILILANSSNPVTNLSIKQVRDIFSGKITNWKQVGGHDQPIVVVMRPHCKNRPGHWKTILPDLEQFRRDRVDVRSAHEMMTHVADFTGAIGHTGAAWDFSGEHHVRILTVSGYKPTAKNLASGKYPFFRTLYSVTNSAPSKDLLELIEFARNSSEFRQIAREYELLPLAGEE